ncbi:ABC transporter ATP-binding protein [Rathayibacter sp. KR2-224]|uniref:ABC transporter ATP-binding protein n=1 Tax=Rathayibacter sp. KR2-224 TaxID=3400913 RepID=UPI003C10EE4C
MKSSRPRGPAGGPAAVRADQWGWRHAGRNAWAVRGLDLHVNAGERILLLGASGSGKSTLLAGIAGVLGGDDDGESEGRLFIDGAEPASNRGRAGLLLQDPESQTVLARVGDDVAFACENLAVPREAIWPRVQQSLDAVGLHVGIRHPTSALSGGQKQRLALAGLLAMQPGILLLDEPTANLDPEGVTEVRDAVAAVLERTGATLLVVEHRVDVWIDVVDRVVVLDGAGGVLADGVPAQVFEQKREQLAEAGVWLPDAQPAAAHTPGDPGSEMLTARDLVVARRRGAGIPIGELALRAGASLALTGANGSGKSTLALTLGGLVPPSAGSVVASDELRAGLGPAPIAWRSSALVTRIGSVFQNPEHQFLAPTVREELAIGPRAAGMRGPAVEASIDDVMERLRLDALAAANPFTLSGGQKRRLSVATAIVTAPRVLVLDEPTFGQDAATWRELVALLAAVRDGGSALVFATHDAELIRALAADRHELATQLVDAA